MAEIVGIILTGILIVLVLGIVGMGAFIFLRILGYKHKIVIKESVNGSKRVIHDKFKEQRDKDGSVWWVLQKTKKRLPPAPLNCVEIDSKGRFYAQYYRLDGDTYVPAMDSFDANKDEIKDLIDKMQPYSQQERSLMVNQHTKAQRDKKKTIGEMLVTAAPYIAIVMILVCFLLFFNDAVKPMKEVGDKYVTVADKLDHAITKLDAVIHDRAYWLEDENLVTDGDNVLVEREVPE